jgi:hypothetical protein
MAKWITKAIRKPGSLRRELGVSKKTGNIPKAKIMKAAKKGGMIGRRARLAKTLGKLRKK